MAMMFKMGIDFENPPGSDWPPVGSETLWVERIGDDRYRLANAPFFASGLACGDEIVASPDPDSPRVLRLGSVEKRSTNSTIRIIVRSGSVSDAREQFAVLGCSSELSHLPTLFAVDVPQASLERALKLADEGFEQGIWDSEDGYIFEQVPHSDT
jgi:Domain of unknown function (DUF4265)